jgi:1-acyl-sn-glycerol-3-phosphate acyltransferase
MKEGIMMHFAYHGVGSTFARYLSLRFGTVFRAELRSEYPEVGQWLADYLCWRFGAITIGTENIPTSGGVLLIGNHQKEFDGPLVIHGSRPRVVRLVVKNDGESQKALQLLRLLTGAVTINRNTNDLETMRTIESILAREGVVCMFPEGHRSEDGKVRGFHPGAAMVARRVPSARIVPFAITNARDLGMGTVVRNLDRGLPGEDKPTIKIGPSFQLPPAHLSRKRQRRLDLTTIRQSVLDLLPKEMEGDDELYVI